MLGLGEEVSLAGVAESPGAVPEAASLDALVTTGNPPDGTTLGSTIITGLNRIA